MYDEHSGLTLAGCEADLSLLSILLELELEEVWAVVLLPEVFNHCLSDRHLGGP